MARIELPQSRLRARRRRRRIVLVSVLVGGFLFLLAGLSLLSRAPFLRIETITVSGAQTVGSSTIEAYVREHMAGSYWFMFAKNNILLYPQNDIAQGLTGAYPTLKTVDVHAADFHTVAVVVSERQPVALWCPSGVSGPPAQCYYTDEGGVVYEPALRGSEEVYVVYQGYASGNGLPKQFLHAGEFQALTALVGALTAVRANSAVHKTEVDALGDVRVYFDDGFILLFTLRDAGGDIFERFTLALKAEPFIGRALSEFEYLDLRFGDKLYYKLK